MNAYLLKKSIFLIICVASLHPCIAQTVIPITGESIVIDSKILKEKCKALVYLPEGYQSATAEKYPVIYVLDGEYYFSFTTEAAALLAQSQLAPSCIIIGVTTNNRQRDFSPPLDADSDQTQDLALAGGADQFLNYLKNELIPSVNEKYRTLPYRVLIGHSTGGLLAYYSLYKAPDLFQAFVSIDGSTWWNNGKVGREVIDYLSHHPDYKGKIVECRKDIKIPVRFPANTELLNYLDKQRPVGLNYMYLELPNETHGTIVFPGTYYGLKGIFSDYKGPEKRAHHGMVYDDANQSVLMMSGSTPVDGGQSGKFFNDSWRYTSAGWTRIADAGDERSDIRLAFNTRDKKIYSFGGFLDNNESSAQLRRFENGSWIILTDMPEMKATGPGFVYDQARDKFIAFGGGQGREQVNSDTWEWDGKQWKKFEGAGPGGRQGFAMVYDSRRKRTVLFGGFGKNPQERFGDTWEFDGRKWQKVSDGGPEARMAPGYAYDSKAGMLLVFGGAAASGIKGDTWGWDGTNWTKLADTGPAPRMMGYMAYDKGRDRTVLFGGRKGWPIDAGDTWEWDGKQWNEVTR